MATKTNTEINGNKYFRITRTIGHEVIDGKRVAVKKQFYGSSKAKALQAYEEFKEAQRLESQKLNDTVKTFGELLSFYEEQVFSPSGDFASSTKKLYLNSTKAFRSADKTGLFRMNIQNVDASNIQVAYNAWDTRRSTVKAVHNHFKSFFKWAVRNRYAADPMSAVVVPLKTTVQRKDDVVIWSDAEIRSIFDNIGDHRLRLLVYMAYFTGMRIGELLGLKYSDLYDNVIHIRRQNHELEILEPKYNSGRDIPISKVLLPEIERHKEWHQREAKRNKYKLDYVFTSRTGHLLHARNVFRSLQRFYESNDITVKSPHTYRATFCTNLCRAGVPLQTASRLMGHKSVNVTSKYYTFVSEQEKADAIAKLKIM